MSFRDDGDALLARNAALEAENAKLREENEQLKEDRRIDGPEEDRRIDGPEATVALVRKTPTYIAIQDRVPWYRRAGAVIVWVAAVLIAILQGVL